MCENWWYRVIATATRSEASIFRYSAAFAPSATASPSHTGFTELKYPRGRSASTPPEATSSSVLETSAPSANTRSAESTRSTPTTSPSQEDGAATAPADAAFTASVSSFAPLAFLAVATQAPRRCSASWRTTPSATLGKSVNTRCPLRTPRSRSSTRDKAVARAASSPKLHATACWGARSAGAEGARTAAAVTARNKDIAGERTLFLKTSP
mmetsp:Transcript_64317/g.145138  ORF Transcript_64317/g.145138 Transcript_64317/m.145138 type:complete len:211 (+) Transcript_64317:467-1099(+)